MSKLPQINANLYKSGKLVFGQDDSPSSIRALPTENPKTPTLLRVKVVEAF